ncbi:MAG: TRAP transporter small permease [Desulfobacteraceae bacterium]|nr:MAG: TRAP transporter small permease [Desulfobacteraceae bacterium]
MGKALLNLSRILALVAGAALTIMMFLTVADVIGRAGGYPILGTAELVSLLCVVAVGFAVPLTSFRRRHVYMEFLIEKMSPKARNSINTATRIVIFLLFALAGANLFHMGNEFAASREVSMALCLPFYPFAYAAGVCCFVQAAVCLHEIVKIWGGEYE